MLYYLILCSFLNLSSKYYIKYRTNKSVWMKKSPFLYSPSVLVGVIVQHWDTVEKEILVTGWTGSCISSLYRVSLRLQRNGFWLQEHGLHFSSRLFTALYEAEMFSWILMFHFSSRAKISSCHGRRKRRIVTRIGARCREENNDGRPKIILMHTVRFRKRNNSGLVLIKMCVLVISLVLIWWSFLWQSRVF